MMQDRWSQPIKVSEVEMSFPLDIEGVLIPHEQDIPPDQNSALIEAVDMSGYSKLGPSGLITDGTPMSTGCDRELARRHIKAIQSCSQIAYLHRVRGIAYLITRWANLSVFNPKH